MKRLIIPSIIVIILISTLLASLLTSYPVYTVKAQLQLPRDKTLYIGVITSSFGTPNYMPFQHGGSPGIDLVLPFPLYYNFMTYTWIPFLVDYQWINDTVLLLKIKDGAKWDDGTPITVDDFIFTYNTTIRERCSDLLYWCRALYTPGSEYFVGWRKVNDTAVELYINSTFIRAYRRIPWVFQWIRLAPKHIFEKEIPPDQWVKTSFYDPAKGWPIGSGPYKLVYFDPSMVVYERKDDWWGWRHVKELGVKLGSLKPDEPYPTDKYPPKYIVWVAIPSADTARALLARGEIDILNSVIPALETWEGLGAWYDKPPYYATYALIAAWFQNPMPPFNFTDFRRALFVALIAFSPDIASKVIMGYGGPVDDPTGLPPIEIYRQRPFYDPDYAIAVFKEFYGLDWPPPKDAAIAKARDLIASIKLPDGTPVFVWDDTAKRFRWNIDVDWLGTYVAKKGDVVKLRWAFGIPPSADDSAVMGVVRDVFSRIGIELEPWLSPASWDDFVLYCRAHIHMASYFIVFQPGPAAAVIPGQYGFIDPMYNSTHTIAEAFPCGAARPPWNPGRYGNLTFSQVLGNFSGIPITDVENNSRLIRELVRIVITDPPIIPLYYSPIGATYSTAYWTNYPTAKNPYGTPWYDYGARSGMFYLFLKPSERPTPTPTTVTVATTVPTTVVTTVPVTVPTTILTTVVTPVVTTLTMPGTTVVTTQMMTQVQTVVTERVIMTERVITTERIITTVAPTTIPTTQTVAVVPTEVWAVIGVLVVIVVALAALYLIRRR